MIDDQKRNTDDISAECNCGNEFLEVKLRVSSPPEHTFKIIERNHVIKNEYWEDIADIMNSTD